MWKKLNMYQTLLKLKLVLTHMKKSVNGMAREDLLGALFATIVIAVFLRLEGNSDCDGINSAFNIYTDGYRGKSSREKGFMRGD